MRRLDMAPLQPNLRASGRGLDHRTIGKGSHQRDSTAAGRILFRVRISDPPTPFIGDGDGESRRIPIVGPQMHHPALCAGDVSELGSVGQGFVNGEYDIAGLVWRQGETPAQPLREFEA